MPVNAAPLGNICVVLVRPQQSGNVGAVARAIANHGMGELRIVDPPAFDPVKARWMAPHAHHIIDKARFFSSIKEATKDLTCLIGASARQRKWEKPNWGFNELHLECQKNSPIGILFGPEDSGLSNEDLKHCQALMTLPTHQHHSLNLSQAVIVFGARLISMLQKNEESISEKREKPSLGMQQKASEAAMAILKQIDYLSSRNETQVHDKLLQWISRSELSERDLKSMKGMINKVYHAIRIRDERID